MAKQPDRRPVLVIYDDRTAEFVGQPLVQLTPLDWVRVPRTATLSRYDDDLGINWRTLDDDYELRVRFMQGPTPPRIYNTVINLTALRLDMQAARKYLRRPA